MQYWIKFKLSKQPITDLKGNILPFGTKRITYARQPRKATLGGEWSVPDLSKVNIIERYQKEEKLLICTDTLISMFVYASFKPIEITEKEAAKMKREFFGIADIIIPVESGVTN